MELKQRLLQNSEMDLTVDNLVTYSTSYERCRVQAKAMTGAELVHQEAEVKLVRSRQRAEGALAQIGTENGRHQGPGPSERGAATGGSRGQPGMPHSHG